MGRKAGAARVKPWRPRQVNDSRPTRSRESASRSTPVARTAACEAPTSPPPQRL